MMKGLWIALRLTAGDSLRGMRRWTDIFHQFPRGFPPPGLAIAGEDYRADQPFPTFTTPKELEDKKAEGFLWGVPKRRRSAEKRYTRRFGLKEWGLKLLKPKYNLLICDNCGHHYEAKTLCRNCYEKTVAETKLIRESIESKVGHGPDDKDVIVLYESDKSSSSTNTPVSQYHFQNKLIVEIPKERPAFFSTNLLQKTTSGINKKAKDVTATDPALIVHKNE